MDDCIFDIIDTPAVVDQAVALLDRCHNGPYRRVFFTAVKPI